MKSEQKRRAIQIVAALQTSGTTVAVEPIISLLQELIDAPEQAAGVPDGWRLVPYTPTVQMLERAEYAVNNRPQPSKYEPSAAPAIIFWTAMLNYAPEAPQDAEPPADVARDAELLDALEDEVRSRGMHGLTLGYTNYVEDGLVVEKGFRLIGRKFIGPRRATLRDAIDAAIKRQGGE